MRNFGFNTLGLVQSVIGKQIYSLEEWAGRVQNARGIWVDSYSDSIDRKASVQPMSSAQALRNGLDSSKIYIKIYDLDLIEILSRSENPPRISWGGYYWTTESSLGNWIDQGGWNKVTLVRQDKVDV